MKYIVYPFRLLGPATFLAAIIAGYTAEKKLFAVLLTVAVLASGYPYTRPKIENFPFDDKYFSQVQLLSNPPGTLKNMAATEFLPKTADLTFIRQVEREYLTSGKLPVKFEFELKAAIKREKVRAEEMALDYESEKNNLLTINTFYFPNWRAAIDGEKASVDMDSAGRMKLRLPAEKHSLELRFGFSEVEKYAYFLSIIGLIILIGESLWIRRKIKLKKTI